MGYRNLSKTEIDNLIKQGCSSEDWNKIQVSEKFITKTIVNSQLSGTVQIGSLKKSLETEVGIQKSCGIYNSTIHNCSIEDDVRISNVKNLVKYRIEKNVLIENVNAIFVSGHTSFGNGTEIEILNEGGRRELQIFDKLSSQIAYLLVIYRHNSEFIKKLNELIKQYVIEKTTDSGIIKQGSIILNCNTIKNISIGENTTISGALHLEEGTIASCIEDPCYIGEGVIAKNFIIQSGSKVDGAAMLHQSFIGQGVKIGRQFSAENSAFFANSEGFHGEACSTFAGPYTVTHHKSTLLIAGLFSFYNAGSGSNQSNHMYKVGPVHQGILERGSKTGSFSYLMWPCRVGAFSGIIGKHYANFDTSDFPFSYILESDCKSILIPAMNLFTVGPKRDSEKWTNRDRRKAPNKFDLINFDLFNPYTIGKIIRGMKELRKLEAKINEPNQLIEHNGIYLKSPKIKKGYESYKSVLNIYIGDELLKQFQKFDKIASIKDLLKYIKPKTSDCNKNWIDLSGMIAPSSLIDSLLKSVTIGEINSIDKLNDQFKIIYESYLKLSWAWCANLIESRLNKSLQEITKKDLIQIITNWKTNKLKYNELVLKDAEKEFSSKSQIGYGLDGDKKIKQKDFEAVRGTFQQNSFVKQIMDESSLIEKKAEEIINRINDLG